MAKANEMDVLVKPLPSTAFSSGASLPSMLRMMVLKSLMVLPNHMRTTTKAVMPAGNN